MDSALRWCGALTSALRISVGAGTGASGAMK